MITQQEQETIWLLSDTELYEQAVEFMHGIAKALPPAQINGLLNVSLSNPYEQLNEFVEYQSQRTTWKANEQHIRAFYKRLLQKLDELNQRASVILVDRTEQASSVDKEEITMELTREFIQHLLAENDYMRAMHIFDDTGAHTSKGSSPKSGDNSNGSWKNSGGKRR